MLLLERMRVFAASVLPPEVFTNVKSDRSKFEYHCVPPSPPLFGATQGEMSIEKTAFGRYWRMAPTNWLMIEPASAGVIGSVCVVPVYWYQSGSISNTMGRVVP